MSASSRRADPSPFDVAMALSAADGDKDWLDFACVIMGYGMLIVLNGGLWEVRQHICVKRSLTHLFSCLWRVSL